MTEKKLGRLIKFLHRYGAVRQDYSLLNRAGKRVDIPIAVEKDGQTFGVWNFDWARSVGANTIIQTEKKLSEYELDGAIVVTNTFSQHAIDVAERINASNDRKLVLFEHSELAMLAPRGAVDERDTSRHTNQPPRYREAQRVSGS